MTKQNLFLILILLVSLPLLSSCDEKKQSTSRQSSMECLLDVDDELRVKIGNNTYLFPRKDIYDVYGDGLKHNSIDSGVQGDEVCQPRHESIQLQTISMFATLLPCHGAKDCHGKKIHIRLQPASPEPTPDYYPAIFEKNCKERTPPRDEWEAEYGLICRTTFQDNGIDYWIQFYNGRQAYPANDIDTTKTLLINHINSMAIK